MAGTKQSTKKRKAAPVEKEAARPDPLDVRRGPARMVMIVLSFLFLFLTAGYNHTTPYESPAQTERFDGGQTNPDEHGHMAYITELAHGHLPVFRVGGQDYEAHQPPLYYLLCEPLYLIARHSGEAGAATAVRWVSVLLGLALAWVVFFLIADLFPERPWIAVCSAGFVGLLPMNMSLCASVTNDTLTNLIVALGLWQIVRVAKGICRRPHSALILGAILGLGIWTKTSTLVLFPAVLVAYWLLARAGVMSSSDAIKRALIACSFGLLIGLPWLIRNTQLYGDPLARHIFVSAFQNTAKTAVMIHVFGSLPSYISGVAQWTFASFWGVFDSMNWFWGRDPQDYGNQGFFLHPPPVIYSLLAVVSVISLIGLLRYFKKEPPEPSQNAALGAFLTLIVMTLLAFVAFNITFFQAQGRYLYTALAPMAFFFVVGLQALAPRRKARQAMAIFFFLLLIGLNFFSIAMLSARFGTG
jgi:uncharacterized membrane protein SirB2